MLICGKVVNSVGYEQSGGGYKYKVKIRKANGRDTTFITNKEIFSRCEYYKDVIFDVDVVYKGNGKLDSKNSTVNRVYIVGEDISNEDYLNQYNNQKLYFSKMETPLDDSTRKMRENNLYTVLITLLVIGVVVLSVYKVITQDKFMKDVKGFEIVEGVVTNISVTDAPTSEGDKEANIWVKYVVDGQNYKIRESAIGTTFLYNDVDGMKEGSVVNILYNPNAPEIGYIATYSDFENTYVPLYGGTYISGYVLVLISMLAVVLLLVHYIRRITKKRALYMQLVWPVMWIITSAIYCVRYSLNYIFGLALSVGVLILVVVSVWLIKKNGEKNK